MCFHQFENPVKKTGVFPFPLPGFFQLPSINNVPIKYEIIAFKLLQKSNDFFGFGSLGAEVNIRDDKCFVIGLQGISFESNLYR